MLKIAELANHILDLVADELEIPKKQIISKSRKAETVDARHMAVRLLHLQNIYPSRIAEIFALSPRNVQYIITTFDTRIQANKQLRNTYVRIAKQIGDTYEIDMK